ERVLQVDSLRDVEHATLEMEVAGRSALHAQSPKSLGGNARRPVPVAGEGLEFCRHDESLQQVRHGHLAFAGRPSLDQAAQRSAKSRWQVSVPVGQANPKVGRVSTK